MKKKILLMILTITILILSGCFNKENKQETENKTIIEKIKTFARGGGTEIELPAVNNLMSGIYLTVDSKNYYYYSFADFLKSSPQQEERFLQIWANCNINSSYLVESTGKAASIAEVRTADNDFRSALNITTRSVLSADFSEKIATDSILIKGIDNLKVYADGYGIKVYFSPETAAFTTAQVISMTASIANSSVLIRYTTDGSEPNVNSQIYTTTSVITVTSSAIIKAKAFHTEWSVGQTWSKSVTISKAEDPVISPNGGTFGDAKNVTIIVGNKDLFVRYTLDGKDPTITNGILYDGQTILINRTGTTTIKAITYQQGYGTSKVVKQEYTIVDVTPPVFGTQISFSNITKDTINLTWGQASDNLTDKKQLRYKVVKNEISTLIDSAEKVDALTGTDVVTDWTYDTTSATIGGLISGKNYFFAVLVKDESGNKVLSTVKSQATLDVQAPTPGNGGVLSITNILETGLTLNWTKATDNLTTVQNLKYKVVRTTSITAIETAAEADAITGSAMLMDWSTDVDTKVVTGLSAGTTYYFTVITKDEAGNRSRYNITGKGTIDTTAPVPGNSGTITAIGVTETGMTLNWTAAVDNVSSAGAIGYKVVRATSGGAIDTVAEADALTGSAILMDWTLDTVTKAVTGLTAGTTYYFVVLTRDTIGNKGLYTVKSQATLALPTVLSITPTDGSTTVTPFTNIVIKFDKAMDSGTFGTVVLGGTTYTNGNNCAITFSTTTTTNDTITVNPTGIFAENTNYSNITIAGFKDQNGNSMLSSNTAAYDFTTGILVAYYPFNGNANDDTGAYNGTVSGATLTTDKNGIANRAYDFNGTNNYITIADNNALDLVKDLSIEAWVKFDAFNFLGGIVTKYQNPTTEANGFVLREGFNSAYNNINMGANDAPTALAINTWYHIVGVVNGSNAEVYINGTKYSGGALGYTLTANSGPVRIGVDFLGGDARYVNGKIDDVKIFNYAMNQEEVTARYAVPTPPEISGITAGSSYNTSKTFTISGTGNIEYSLNGGTSWTTYSGDVTLSNSGSYNVIARKIGSYGLVSGWSADLPITIDLTAPTAGNSGTVTTASVTSTSLTLNWTAASDNISTTANLQYRVVKGSASTAIDTIAEVDAISGADLIMDWTANTVTKAVTGLTSGTTYYFAVMVKDEVGNKTLYTVKSEATTVISLANVYISDFNASKIKSVVLATTTVAIFGTAGTNPMSIVKVGSYFYIANYNANGVGSIYKMDATTGGSVKLADVGNGSIGIVHDSGYLYTANYGGNSINKVDITSGAVTTVTASGLSMPFGIVSDGSFLYVTNSSTNTISKIDKTTGAVSTFTSTGLSTPFGIVALGSYYYVANSSGNSVSKVDKTTGTASSFVTGVTGASNITTDGTYLYVSSSTSGLISKIDTAGTVMATYNTAVTTVYGLIALP